MAAADVVRAVTIFRTLLGRMSTGPHTMPRGASPSPGWVSNTAMNSEFVAMISASTLLRSAALTPTQPARLEIVISGAVDVEVGTLMRSTTTAGSAPASARLARAGSGF